MHNARRQGVDLAACHLACHHAPRKIALYRYLQPAADSFPDPKENNLLHYSSSAVRSVTTKQPAKRGKFTPQQQAKVAQYASMHGIAAAKRRFSKGLHADLMESTIRTWKTKYLAEISHKKRSGKVDMDMMRGQIKLLRFVSTKIKPPRGDFKKTSRHVISRHP